jgi:hypothetical protein
MASAWAKLCGESIQNIQSFAPSIFRMVQVPFPEDGIFSSPLFSEGEEFFLTCWVFSFASSYVGSGY